MVAVSRYTLLNETGCGGGAVGRAERICDMPGVRADTWQRGSPPRTQSAQHVSSAQNSPQAAALASKLRSLEAKMIIVQEDARDSADRASAAEARVSGLVSEQQRERKRAVAAQGQAERLSTALERAEQQLDGARARELAATSRAKALAEAAEKATAECAQLREQASSAAEQLEAAQRELAGSRTRAQDLQREGERMAKSLAMLERLLGMERARGAAAEDSEGMGGSGSGTAALGRYERTSAALLAAAARQQALEEELAALRAHQHDQPSGAALARQHGHRDSAAGLAIEQSRERGMAVWARRNSLRRALRSWRCGTCARRRATVTCERAKRGGTQRILRSVWSTWWQCSRRSRSTEVAQLARELRQLEDILSQPQQSALPPVPQQWPVQQQPALPLRSSLPQLPGDSESSSAASDFASEEDADALTEQNADGGSAKVPLAPPALIRQGLRELIDDALHSGELALAESVLEAVDGPGGGFDAAEVDENDGMLVRWCQHLVHLNAVRFDVVLTCYAGRT